MSNDWQQDPPNNPNPHTQQQNPQQPGQGHPGEFGQQQQYDQPPVAQPNANDSLEQNDIIAIALAWFFPGVGQIMLGQKTKGIVILVVSLLTCYLGGILGFASVLDAFCLAKARKKRPVDEWEFFPDLNDAF